MNSRTGIAAVVALLLGSGLVALELQRPSSATWITAWGSSQQGLGTATMTNATVRMVARVTIPGEAVRIRLDNTFGTSPLAIGRMYVGQRVQGPALAAGSNRQAFFKGSGSVTVPPGGSVVSEPVQMHVSAWEDLAVSLYIPETNVRPSQHGGAAVTSYVSANGSGDVAADESRAPFTGTTTSMFWLKAIDVLSASSSGAIVAFGDSITDGTCTTLDAHDRWEDWLALRFLLDAENRGNTGVTRAVVNEGIGGNTIGRETLQPPADSPPGIERLDRDVLAHDGVTHVILFMGTNDIRRGASAAQVIAETGDIIKRVKARGMKIIGATIIPRHNVAASGTNTGWNLAKSGIRNDVNQWIRTKAPFDAVIDFDKMVRDPANADLIYPPFNCGDGIHPSPLGYYEMGKSVRLDFFESGLAPTSAR
jgi:lysophospholipase L1-like esterase